MYSECLQILAEFSNSEREQGNGREEGTEEGEVKRPEGRGRG